MGVSLLMNNITILTQDFRHDLENTLNLRCRTTGVLHIAHGSACTEALTVLLERIVILKHPVYGHSPKLVDIAQGLHQKKIHQTNIAELTSYLMENDVLHLEGYAAFRMSDYKHKLDIMMYSAIKKLKLADALF